jgi:hypothetical protein
MQHPLVHWLYAVMAIALTSPIVSDCKYIAETVYQNYKGQNAKASSSIGLCRGMKYGIWHGGICLGCRRDVCNDDISHRPKLYSTRRLEC